MKDLNIARIPISFPNRDNFFTVNESPSAAITFISDGLSLWTINERNNFTRLFQTCCIPHITMMTIIYSEIFPLLRKTALDHSFLIKRTFGKHECFSIFRGSSLHLRIPKRDIQFWKSNIFLLHACILFVHLQRLIRFPDRYNIYTLFNVSKKTRRLKQWRFVFLNSLSLWSIEVLKLNWVIC